MSASSFANIRSPVLLVLFAPALALFTGRPHAQQPAAGGKGLALPRAGDGRAQVDRQPRRSRLPLELRAPGPRGGYACDDAREKFVRDFVAAWEKVMTLDRFDLA